MVKYEPKRPKLEWDEDEVVLTGQTVIEDEPEWTGLFDADGNPLYRVRERMGF